MPARPLCRASVCLLTLLMLVLSPSQARAQAKTFDVVSIRQNTSQDQRGGPPNLSPTPDGFRASAPLMLILLTTYTPKEGGLFMNRIENLPAWAKSDSYTIEARISDVDHFAWNDPKNQPQMLQQMLQAMLADRFNLVVHSGTTEKPAYELLVINGGPKFQETKPDEPRPAGWGLPGGGVIGPPAKPGMLSNHLYNFSMGMLAALLSDKADRAVIDKTGLTGRYSIDFGEARPMGVTSVAPDARYDDPKPTMEDVLKGLGLKLQPAKLSIETLVIDHLDKPTEN